METEGGNGDFVPEKGGTLVVLAWSNIISPRVLGCSINLKAPIDIGICSQPQRTVIKPNLRSSAPASRRARERAAFCCQPGRSLLAVEVGRYLGQRGPFAVRRREPARPIAMHSGSPCILPKVSYQSILYLINPTVMRPHPNDFGHSADPSPDGLQHPRWPRPVGTPTRAADTVSSGSCRVVVPRVIDLSHVCSSFAPPSKVVRSSLPSAKRRVALSRYFGPECFQVVLVGNGLV